MHLLRIVLLEAADMRIAKGDKFAYIITICPTTPTIASKEDTLFLRTYQVENFRLSATDRCWHVRFGDAAILAGEALAGKLPVAQVVGDRFTPSRIGIAVVASREGVENDIETLSEGSLAILFFFLSPRRSGLRPRSLLSKFAQFSQVPYQPSDVISILILKHSKFRLLLDSKV